MLDERIKALISAAVDGELGDEERAELNDCLERSEEARNYSAGLSRLDRLLVNLPSEPMPERLREQILEGIPLPESSPEPRRFRLTSLPGMLRYGLAASVGLLIAVGIYEFRPPPGSPQDLEGMVGTLVPSGKATQIEVVDAYVLKRGGLVSTARLERRDGALVLDVEFDSVQPVDLNVSLTGDGLVFDALAQTKNNLDSFEFADRVIRASGRGRQAFTVLLDRIDGSDKGKEATIKLEFSSRGGLIEEGVLVPDL